VPQGGGKGSKNTVEKTDTPEVGSIKKSEDGCGHTDTPEVPTSVDTCETIEEVMSDLGKIEVDEGSGSRCIVDEVLSDHGYVDGGIREDGASVSGEEEGVASGGSAVMEIVTSGISEQIPREALAKATSADPTLQLARQLASENSQGYRLEGGIVRRDRLNEFGENISQICVPSEYRKRVLDLVHTRFGHQGRNKMLALMRPFFYWPKMAKDCVRHIKGCTTCQSYDKTNPPRSYMRRLLKRS